MNVPRATMRLQLHRDFTFADAARLVPYLAGLGISHLYASPILAARAGSIHGYDVIDPTRVNPELGGEAGLRDLVAALRGAGMGLIVDIVPNHMASGGLENPWWADVLRHGRASRYATFFDIDWQMGDGKLLAPFLGEPYGDALREGAITLERDDDGPVIRYFDHRFPIRHEDHAEIAATRHDAYDPATQAGRGRLHRLLERQHYRLAWWACAGDAINWRRFFNINDLVGLRIEDAAVFEATHVALFRLYQEGLIDGVRVDHVDGLADPPGYCHQLRSRLDALAPLRPADAPASPAWLVVEKILGAGERLPTDWWVHGTSGYDFMDEVGALLHDPSGEAPLRRFWGAVSRRPADFAIEEIAARREVLDRAFAAQFGATVASVHRIAAMRIETRDVTPAAIRRGLVRLLTHFPVYRSYGVGRSDALTHAVAGAMRGARAADRMTLALLERWLGEDATPEAAVRFQQLCAPLAAKAVEDTAFYRYGVLLSRNEVGAELRSFSATPEDFHAACLARARDFPDAMLATATHDHKRGEDVRARLAVLSEIPQEWESTVQRWFALNVPHRRNGDSPSPSPGDEAMLYQMIIGAWPTGAADLLDFTERLAGWQLKALREAKLATAWDAPDTDYEDAARSFLYTIMTDDGFVADAAAFARRIGPAGAVNGLAQTLLKLTAPGVPDIYQGSEYWDLSMVDPDNRRPVDFASRIEALQADATPNELAEQWRDGRVKQAVIRRTLALRRAKAKLFAHGAYHPLRASGILAGHVVAFLRAHEDQLCLVVVPRLVNRLLRDGDQILTAKACWRDTVLHLPEETRGRKLSDAFTGECVDALDKELPLDRILAGFPVAIWG